jgi:hypothetical protein
MHHFLKRKKIRLFIGWPNISTLWRIRETFGKHYEHELHILHPISSNSNILIISCQFTNVISSINLIVKH